MVSCSAFIVGLVSLAILIVFPKVTEKIPPSLIAVIVAILMVKLLHMNVKTIGDLYTISNKVPGIFMPKISLGMIRDLFPDALTIAVLAGIESLLSCVVSDGMIGSRHKPNMELVAQGAGNIVSALFGDRCDCKNRSQCKKRWTNTGCGNGSFRDIAFSTCCINAVCRMDSNACDCRHFVYGCI